MLSFWSAALIHAISIVAWPMDLIRYFLYFAVALCECLLFAQMSRPHEWFGYSIVCFVVTLALYAYDYRALVRRRTDFEGSDDRRRLFRHVMARQRLEMLFLIPAGLAFNVAGYALSGRNPRTDTALAVIQFLFALLFVVGFVASFEQRQKLIQARDK